MNEKDTPVLTKEEEEETSGSALFNPVLEEDYWREHYKTRPYYSAETEYDEYLPAYRYGWESATRPEYHGKGFEDVENELAQEWPSYSKTPRQFSDVRDAARDAFERIRSNSSDVVREADRKTGSIWEQVEGNWRQFKGTLKDKWGRLTDDEIDQLEGKKDRIVGKIQEKYGQAKWKISDIEEELSRK